MSTYHHGDLRNALVDAGLTLVGQADELSLREVARHVGVSATAVYRHFPDKAALLREVAGAGLRQLGAAQRVAFDAAGGGVDGFHATGVAYVRFALEHPALFRLIFTQPVKNGTKRASASEKDAMGFLLANAAALAPPEVDAEVFALQAWSLAHGLALLMLDGQVPANLELVAGVVDAHAMLGR